MTPAEAIAFLDDKFHMTQAEIAKAVGANQSTIHRIATGAVKQPSYELGKALVDLAASVIAQGAKPSSEAA